ncbi:MAG TPA: RNA polymerase sigma-70 factor [Bacteroidia bacterium]|nr:RNA polymerase sigma-70 factor [Bacteroidia bacterium]
MHNPSAFEAMFRKFQPGLVRFAFVHLRSQEDAREVVQEVFINVWDKRDQLSFDEELKYYLFRAVKNACLNLIKKRRLETVSLEEALTAAEEQLGEGTETQRRFKAVMAQIDQLPEMCREIFLMSRMEGLSHKEIAEILEIAPKTVENQIGIGLKKIREGMKK